MFTRWMFSRGTESHVASEPFPAAPAIVAVGVAWSIAAARLAMAVMHHEAGIDPVLSAFAVVALPGALALGRVWPNE